jgi:hypothetical protein
LTQKLLFRTKSDHNIGFVEKFPFLTENWRKSPKIAIITLTTVRVTRLGEFSPKWAIVYFGQFFENCRSSLHFFATFCLSRDDVLILTKNRLGLIFGDFFTNSTGTLTTVLQKKKVKDFLSCLLLLLLLLLINYYYYYCSSSRVLREHFPADKGFLY